MDQLPIYDLLTGKHEPLLDTEVCNLIYCIEESTIPVVDYLGKFMMGAEVHHVSSVEEAVRNYFCATRRQHQIGMPYSHFFVLHTNICDVYVAGNEFLRHYNMYSEDDYEGDVIVDFWLFRARYHRSMLTEPMDTFLQRQPAPTADIVESSGIKIDGATTIDTLLGHPVIGYDTWDCSSLCEDCNPEVDATVTTRRDRRRQEAKNGKRAKSPKRPLSAYMFFSEANFTRVRRENPDKTFGGACVLLGSEWRVLSEEARRVYDKRSEDDRKRYMAEKELALVESDY